MARLQNKVAIITGAAGGLGREDALLFAREGARVVITDINETDGRAVAAEIGGAAMFIRHDISSEAGWQEVIKSTEEQFGGVDILVNNAAVLAYGTIEDTTLEQWQTIMRVNADSYFLGCKYAVAAMKKRGGGSIVNMSSLAGIGGLSSFCAYSASKGAVAAMTRSIAIWSKRFKLNIRCNSVHPDGIKTPMISKLFENLKPGAPPEVKDMDETMSRMADPIDIANLVLFLASDESRFINGTEMRIDNGWLINCD